MICGKKERYLNQKSEARPHGKNRMITMLAIKSPNHGVTFLPPVHGADFGKFGSHAVLDTPLRLLPGFRKMIERQKHNVHDKAHEHKSKPPRSAPGMTEIKRKTHSHLKRRNQG